MQSSSSEDSINHYESQCNADNAHSQEEQTPVIPKSELKHNEETDSKIE